MDLARQLKQGISSGKILFGQRQTSSACAKGDVKIAIVAANCPESYINNLRTSNPDLVIHQVMMVNRQLGAACGKPFPVSALGILDSGQSDLSQLKSNI
ncbi:MAG: 50S ribosomal protein L30e [Euryarchaeota archaeon]|nr:50S ribosomal protein L30e [Euryarchaeota archaeon]|tara:strand:+ start:718 stop:1014 length:297 start_codon:yes stop_codon:yes gene_type:complete